MGRVGPGFGKGKNAMTHGFFAHLTTGFDGADFDAVYAELEAEFQPASFSTKILLRQLCIDIVRLTRLQRFEAEALREELDPPQFVDPMGFDDSFKPQLVHQGQKSQISPTFLEKV